MRDKREVKVGDVRIGGDNPVVIQSMTNTPTTDINKSLSQIEDLARAGCQIVRLAVPDMSAAESLKTIVEHSPLPVVADIHYDYRLALKAIENGAQKVRINPGNIGSFKKVALILRAAQDAKIPIRIGVNSGSLESDLLEKYGAPTPEALCESMARYVAFCESEGFSNLVLSVKTPDVRDMIRANELLDERFDYPLHLGVTEAGFGEGALIKSAIGIGTLLKDGIGDTIRVSLTGDPVTEISAAREILSALGIKGERATPELISCPTCGRTKIDLVGIASEVRSRLATIDKDIKVAVMGCSVNGPGEARNADIGIAGAGDSAVLFKRGEVVRRLDENEIVDVLLEEIEKT